MMKFLRSQSQTVLVVVLGVIALGFLFYNSSGNLLTNSGAPTSNDYGRIDGEDLTVAELTDAVRNTRDEFIIHGQSEQLSQPGVGAQIAEIAWSQLLLLHEADRLHITVSNEQLVDYIRSMAPFQKDGVFSPDAYQSSMGVLQIKLNMPSDDGPDKLASTKTLFENILRDELRLDAVRAALYSGVRGSAGEVSTQYEKFYGPETASLVTFDPKNFIASAQVTAADIAAEYKAHPENPAYRTAEKRRVDYVLLLLSPEQMKLPDAQKGAAKDALGQKALDFALAFQPEPSATGETPPPPPDFMAEAKKMGLTPATSEFFAEDARPANVPPSSAFNGAAFSLTKDEPISKVVDLDNGVAVLHLAEIQPSELRPLEEVKAEIEEQLKQTKAAEAARVTAQIMAKTLQAEVAKGADFKTAATGMKLKVETLPAFEPYPILTGKTPPTDPRMETIAYATISLAPGQVSDPVPMRTDDTTLAIHLDGRAKADPAGLAAFEMQFRESQDERLRQAVDVDWTNWKSKQPGTRKPYDLDAYGSVE
ncbi:MAG TPA: SurA N-terminal domain-containing protein [Candidatus Methylacidiphilales bacterium]|jgi:peptidyl-prolyl cis-trans isomerase D|nr:SurA N-terminal domain-containing protein [Candidatus Methylacidiphilales bacterium]